MSGRSEIPGKQIKDDSVESVDIKDETLTIDDFSQALKDDIENQPFTPGSTPLSSTTIGDAIRESITITSAAASPGFSFGRNGSLSQNTWLRRPGNVPSNRAGVTININNPVITTIAVANRNAETFRVEVYEHEGNSVNLTLLGFVDIVNAASEIFENLNISATKGKQLAVRLGNTSTGNVRDLGVDLTLKGTS